MRRGIFLFISLFLGDSGWGLAVYNYLLFFINVPSYNELFETYQKLNKNIFMIGGHKNSYTKSIVFGIAIFAASSLTGVSLAALTFNSTSVSSDGAYTATASTTYTVTAGNNTVIYGSSTNPFVGINTTSPTQNLSVGGDIGLMQATSSLYIAGTPFLSASGSITCVGLNACSRAVAAGGDLTALGYQAASGTVGRFGDTFVGYQAGYGLTGDGGGGDGYSVAIGQYALSSGATADYEVAIGYGALQHTTGASNVGIGVSALQANTSGFDNTGVGANALKVNTTGSDNTALGYNALTANTTSTNTTAVGSRALAANTIGSSNSAFGRSSLLNNTTGNQNIAVGSNAGQTITTGSNNTFVGYTADAGSNNLSNAAAFGYLATVRSSNALVLGATGSNQPNIGIGTSTPFALFTVATSTTSNFFSVLSSGKVGIATTTPGSQLTIATGDTYIASTSAGVILQPVAGTCFRLSLTSSGGISTTSVTCP